MLSTHTILRALTLLFLCACSPYRPFYQPTKHLYLDPQNIGLPYEMHQMESLNGNTIYAALFLTDTSPHGIVVHFHGNYGNISNHFLASQWLTEYGFDVLIFDYQGYGGSEGRPSPKNLIADGRAAIRYAATLSRGRNKAVFVLGQSLGGAAAIPAVAQEPGVRAAVIEASFPSYRTMARNVIARSPLLWILYPIYPWFLGTNYDPVRYVEKISPRPVLFVHGDADHIIPLKMSQILFDKAKEPKTLAVVAGMDHIGGWRAKEDAYKKLVADFFEKYGN